jgi:hypothetical protein
MLCVLLGAEVALAQSNTRLLLSAGMGVPGHAGFVFGPFSHLAMNESDHIVFLSSLRSPRSEIPAVVRSQGVTFSVVAFQGLRSPIPKTTYDTFSAPSLNDAGAIAFTATLKDKEESPDSAVIRIDASGARAVATAGDKVPGTADATFQEFSAPLITSRGDVVFGARYDGAHAGTGLFLSTAAGIQALDLPAGLKLSPKDLLEPVFFSHDEAAWVVRGTPLGDFLEQFFRAIAIRSFQDLKPPPDPSESVEALAANAGEAPVQVVLVLMEGGSAQTALLAGDPTQPVMARKSPAGVVFKPLGRIQGQTTGARGNIIFAANAADDLSDVGLYCYCDGQVVRLTSPEEFLPITQSAAGKPISSVAGDTQQAVAFIAPSGSESNASIYVTSLP